MVAEKVQHKTRKLYRPVHFSSQSFNIRPHELVFCGVSAEDFFYAIWPLSRFVGYRPPAFPDFDDSFHSRLVYQLPTRYHRAHVERLKREAEERNRRGEQGVPGRDSGDTLVEEEARRAKEWKQEREEKKSLWGRFGDKVCHMVITYVAAFAAIAFLALCECCFVPQSASFSVSDSQIRAHSTAARAAIFFNRGAPVVVAAFATEAVILYSEYQSPLAQPVRPFPRAL